MLGHPDTNTIQAKKIISEAVTYFPEKFDGTDSSFFFELRYVPPFDKGFTELKRLQATAAVIGGRRSDFKGYIVINLSNYLEHDKEHYFKIALQFLSDMNDCWKYIFLVDNKNENASKTLVISTLQILLNDIPCEVKYENTFYNTDIIDTTLTEKNVTCSEPVKKLFNDMLKDEILSKDTISILIQNISGYYGPQISMRTIRHFFKNKDPVIKYMITKRQYDHLINMLQLGGEYTYEYKQEI